MQDISIHRITTLNDDQVDKASSILVEAFTSTGDPLLVAYVGGDMSLSQGLFRAFITAAIREGEAYFAQLDNEIIGVSCWFGPGQQFVKSPQQREWDRYWREGLSQMGKEWQTETYLPKSIALSSRCLPTPTTKLDGYYLSLLGVPPAFRGKGIGKRLVQVGLERAQEQDALVSVETYTDDNVSFYKNCGFRIAGADTIPSPWGDLRMAVLMWEPENHL